MPRRLASRPVAHDTLCVSRNMRLTLSKPVYHPFNVHPWASRIFVVLFVAISVFVSLAVVAGSGYDSNALFSTNYTQTTFLWYEGKFRPWLDVPPSWTCQGSVLQHGQGLIPAIHF